jgi:hypothetical protein
MHAGEDQPAHVADALEARGAISFGFGEVERELRVFPPSSSATVLPWPGRAR